MHRLLFYQFQVSDTNVLTEPMRHFDTASRVLMIHFHVPTNSDQLFIPQSKIVKAYWLALEKNVNTTVRLLMKPRFKKHNKSTHPQQKDKLELHEKNWFAHKPLR